MAEMNFLANNTAIALDASIEARAEPERYPYRIKASEIGDDCSRKLWASLRWTTKPQPVSPQTKRIFGLGHYIEERMIADFKAMPGLMVKDREFDEHGQPTDKQIGVAFADGHGYGYVDCLLYGLPEAPKTVHVCEVKSMKNTDFNATFKHGVVKTKPLHHAQFQIYMHELKYDRALYAFECKNTSQRHFERVEYDFALATQLSVKGERIAFAEEAPVRAYEEGDQRCNWCNHKQWCWKLTIDLPERTCRTCAHVSPQSGGKWACNRHGISSLKREDQEKGCGQHLYNPEMVNGEICGGDGRNTVIYRMADGSQFVDAVKTDDPAR